VAKLPSDELNPSRAVCDGTTARIRHVVDDPIRGATVKRLIDESFEVAVPLSLAWDHLAQVENWPTWAKHIKSVVRTPAGPLSIDTQATVRLTNGMTSTFKMIEFAPPSHWKWRGSLLGAQIYYDHVFSEIAPGQTGVQFTVDASGRQVTILGGIFASMYRRNLRGAVPLLIAEIEALARSNR
jgi:hypothetical protein